jgi:hypothetical protein
MIPAHIHHDTLGLLCLDYPVITITYDIGPFPSSAYFSYYCTLDEARHNLRAALEPADTATFTAEGHVLRWDWRLNDFTAVDGAAMLAEEWGGPAPAGTPYVRLDCDIADGPVPEEGADMVTDPATGASKQEKLARFDLIPARPLEQVAEHYGIGDRKYGYTVVMRTIAELATLCSCDALNATETDPIRPSGSVRLARESDSWETLRRACEGHSTTCRISQAKEGPDGFVYQETRNWEKGYRWSLSFGALMRHAWAFWGGEDYDTETGSHHMAAVCFHAMALMEFGRTNQDKDDRVRHKLGKCTVGWGEEDRT